MHVSGFAKEKAASSGTVVFLQNRFLKFAFSFLQQSQKFCCAYISMIMSVFSVNNGDRFSADVKQVISSLVLCEKEFVFQDTLSFLDEPGNRTCFVSKYSFDLHRKTSFSYSFKEYGLFYTENSLRLLFSGFGKRKAPQRRADYMLFVLINCRKELCFQDNHHYRMLFLMHSFFQSLPLALRLL